MMALGYMRKLISDDQIFPFVEQVLCIQGEAKVDEAIQKIKRSEIWMDNYCENSTFTDKRFRNIRYNTAAKRQQLQSQIVSELFTLERLDDDEKTELGRGGAKPRGCDPSNDGNIYLIIGLPASGKSNIANTIADFTASYLIDSDLAKRKLPEYKNDGGASLVHDESSMLSDKLLVECKKCKLNMVIPKIGGEFDSIKKLSAEFIDNGYKVYLVLVELDRMLATQRAYNRYLETERYIPLSLIYDSYANEPILTYYRIKQRSSNLVSGYLHLDNDVPKGSSPVIVECFCMDDIRKLFN